MSDAEFHVDDESFRQAQSLTAALKKLHATRIAERGVEVIRAELRAGRGSAEAVGDLASPLDEIAEEIPVRDIQADVREFGLVAALARVNRGRITALRMGPKERPVPILPAHGLLAILLGIRRPLRPASLMRAFLTVATPATDKALVVRLSWSDGQEAFFHGLGSYLAARIAGVRWLRGQLILQSPVHAAGSAGTRGGGGSGQWWQVHTQARGLSVYYGGTHAVRNPPNFLAAPTTPLHAFLPMGTLHLGADAGPGGKIVWDNSVITVPSHTPTFSTKRF